MSRDKVGLGLVAALLIGTLAVVVLASRDEADPEPKGAVETAQTPAPTLSPADYEKSFLLNVRGAYEEIGPLGDEYLVGMGNLVCTMLDSGNSFIDAANLGVSAGFSAEAGSYLAGAAVSAFCPEYGVLVRP